MTWGALHLVALAIAVGVAVTPGAPGLADRILRPGFDPPPARLADAARLFAHNLLALAPALLGPTVVAWLGRGRRALDTVVALQLLPVIGVGAAAGTYGTAVLPWLVHVPVEWAALATALAYYTGARAPADPAQRRVPSALLVIAFLAVAAALEIFATPPS